LLSGEVQPAEESPRRFGARFGALRFEKGRNHDHGGGSREADEERDGENSNQLYPKAGRYAQQNQANGECSVDCWLKCLGVTFRLQQIEEMERRVEEMEKTKGEVEDEMQEMQRDIENIQECHEDLQETLEERITQRQMTFELLLQVQKKLNAYSDITKGRKPHLVYRTESVLTSGFNKEMSVNSKLSKIVENLQGDFPNHVHELNRLSNSLKLPVFVYFQ
jgi:Txe/YoeB family toxin of Txe-Axe toxin-antitoxin module